MAGKLTLAVAIVCTLSVLGGLSSAQDPTTTTIPSDAAPSPSSSSAPTATDASSAVSAEQSSTSASTSTTPSTTFSFSITSTVSSSTSTSTPPSTMSSSAASSTSSIASTSTSSSSSAMSQPSTSTTLSSSSSSAAASSSSPLAPTTSTAVAATTTSDPAVSSSTTVYGNGPVIRRTKDPVKARWIAAVVSGCGLFLVTMVSFTVIAFIIRSTIRLEKRKTMKALPRRSIAADGQFYSGLEPYSAQALVSSLSGSSIAVSHSSDIHLDTHAGGRGVYHNRGFDGHHEAPIASTSSSGSDVNGHFEESYKPIEIKASKGNVGVSRHSEA